MRSDGWWSHARRSSKHRHCDWLLAQARCFASGTTSMGMQGRSLNSTEFAHHAASVTGVIEAQASVHSHRCCLCLAALPPRRGYGGDRCPHAALVAASPRADPHRRVLAQICVFRASWEQIGWPEQQVSSVYTRRETNNACGREVIQDIRESRWHLSGERRRLLASRISLRSQHLVRGLFSTLLESRARPAGATLCRKKNPSPVRSQRARGGGRGKPPPTGMEEHRVCISHAVPATHS